MNSKINKQSNHFIKFSISVLLTAYIFGFLTVANVSAQQIAIPPASAWTDHGMVVDAAPFGSGWDTLFEGITPATLIKKDNLYYLYYIGADNYIAQKDNIGPAHRSVGVATSTDGVRWTKYSGNPVLTFSSSGNPEEGAVSTGVTVGTDGIFRAFYGTNIASTPTTPQVNANVRLATSSNGLSFSDQGIVLRYNDSSVWGYGDELHSVAAIQLNGVWYVYYVPNGTPQGRMLGVAWGTSPTVLNSSSAVLSSGSTINGGPTSIVPLDNNRLAIFTTRAGTTEVRIAQTSDPKTVSSPAATYNFNGYGKVVYLDQAKRTWFMIYDNWMYMGLRTAPMGTVDTTPPSLTGNLRVKSRTYNSVELEWNAATDADTGVVSYNVYRNNVKIGNTKNLYFKDPAVLTEQTSYNYQVSAVNYHMTEGSRSSLSVSTLADQVAPKTATIQASGTATSVVVTLDETVVRTTAENIANYRIDGLSISSATLSSDEKTVTLTTSTQVNNRQYLLTVTNVEDRSAARNKANTQGSYTYSQIPALAGLWRVEQGSQIVGLDSSGFATHAAVKGSPTWITGQLGNAVRLNGTSDYLEVEAGSSLEKTFSDSFSLTGWIRPEGVPPYTTNSNLAYTLFSGPNIRVKYDNQRRMSASISTTAGSVDLAAGTYASDAWYHLAVIADETNRRLQLYVNGVQVTGSPKSFTGSLRDLPTPIVGVMDTYYSRFRIGVHDPLFEWEKDYLKGAIDDVRIYRKVLTAAEVTAIYNLREGVVTNAPTATITTSSPTPILKPGDANGDGRVDGLDYVVWLNHYGSTSSTGPSQGDFNGDGRVDGLDYVVWLNNYGT